MGNASVKAHGHGHGHGHRHGHGKSYIHKKRSGYGRFNRRTRHHYGGNSPLNPGHTKTSRRTVTKKQTPFSRAVIVGEAFKAEVIGNTARTEKAEADKRIKAAKSQAALDKAMRLEDFFKSVEESHQKDMKRHFADKATRRKAAEKKDIEFEARRTARRTGKIKLIKRSPMKDASA